MVADFTGTAAVPLGAAVPSLVRWGLSVDADLVFRTLATFGPRTPRALAEELGLSRHRITTALEELRTAGAAATESGAGIRRSPIWFHRHPAEVIATLRSRRLRLVDPNAQAAHHQGVIRALADRLGDAGIALTPASLGGTLSDHVRFYPTFRQGRARQTELGNAQRFDRLVINTEQSYAPEVAQAATPNMRSLVERNIRFRIISVPPADGDQYQPGDNYANQTTYLSREALQVPLKMIVMDHRVAFFPIDPRNLDRGYLEVTHRGVVDSLIAVFEKHWGTATDPSRLAVPQILLSEREQALIGLLAEGHTDITAAENLRISARSVTNILRALMDRIGVDNRFQLGLTLGTMRAAVPPALSGLVVPQRPTLIR
jgi:DNA-binding CsgD family transcriptional regulator/biotin operon repressor